MIDRTETKNCDKARTEKIVDALNPYNHTVSMFLLLFVCRVSISFFFSSSSLLRRAFFACTELSLYNQLLLSVFKQRNGI